MPRLLPFALLALAACADPSAPPPAEAPAEAASAALPTAGPAAAPDSGSGTGGAASVAAAYDFARPTASYRLPASLVEISGLTALPDGRLAAVQDERGVAYTLDAASGAVVAEHAFEGRGDFEGVEWAGNALWVLKSNGKLYEFPGGSGPGREHDTPLRGRCDAEGLALDAARNRLLISCKEDPGEGLGRVRAVYAYSLQTRQMATAPAFTLTRAALDAGNDAFKPSALAVHPRTGQLFVLSSVRKAIAIVGADGRLAEVVPLAARLFRQPEGLAFLPDGTLFIASEGAGSDAMLFRFAERR